MLEVEDAVDFARNVDFAAPVYGIETSEEYSSLVERLTGQLGYSPNTYVILSYEALYAAAITLADMEDGEKVSVLKERLINTLNGYEGVTGTIELNDVALTDLRGELLAWESRPHPVRSDPAGTRALITELCEACLAAPAAAAPPWRNRLTAALIPAGRTAMAGKNRIGARRR